MTDARKKAALAKYYATDFAGNATPLCSKKEAQQFAHQHGGKVHGPRRWWQFWRAAR